MSEQQTNHMAYMEGMEVLDSDTMDQVLAAMDRYEENRYRKEDVECALSHDIRTPQDFAALLSQAAEPFLEKMAQVARMETRMHFGNSVSIFTPIYISNYCENYCIYCGFHCHNKIQRARLTPTEIEKEMKAIAETGLEEILILVGESRIKSDVEYLGESCKDAFVTGMHAWILQRKYPQAEIAFSCPRLRPIINNDKVNPRDVHEAQLLQVILAFRLFMPFASITISTRESAKFRNHVIGIAATKISAGVNTGVGGHAEEVEDKGDDQFEIADKRGVQEIYQAILDQGMQPVMNDYVYV